VPDGIENPDLLKKHIYEAKEIIFIQTKEIVNMRYSIMKQNKEKAEILHTM